MRDFTFTIPQTVQFGVGSLEKLPELVKKSNSTKVLIISDNGLSAIGVVKKVTDIIDSAGLSYAVFLDVEANPSVETVNKAVSFYRENGCTSIIALGGGSPMDVSKATALLAIHGGDIRQYEGLDKVPGPVTPIIAIPTTAGTGSEATIWAVVTDTQRNYKMSIGSTHLIPQYALLDPKMIMSLPPHIAAASGMDALVHAIESYLSLASSPFSDAMATQAMELIGRNIRKFVANRNNESAACAMMVGSMFAGIAFSWAKLGDVHAMAHPVSGYFHVAHGIANAILLPVVLEYNALGSDEKYEEIYRYIGGPLKSGEIFEPQMLVEEIQELNRALGIPEGLATVGVQEELIPAMAADAFKSGNIAINPRQTTQRDLELLYHKAL